MRSLVGRPVVPFLLPLVVISLLWGLAGQSAPKRYDPDPEVCQVERIRQTFQANLLPWADEPAAVQQRLRQLQAAITLDTLRDCQAKGLLKPDQVDSLGVELGLPPLTPGVAPSPVRP